MLEEIKKYLGINDDYDNDLIIELIEVAELYIISCVGEGYKQNPVGIKLSLILIKKLVAEMYENRSMSIVSNTIPRPDRISTTILDSLANMEVIE